MDLQSLHDWDVDSARARELQEELRARISLRDSLAPEKIRWIAGADVSYDRGAEETYGAVVVLSFPHLRVAEERWVKGRVSFPYIPGLLSFRELPVLLKAFSLLRQRPDAVIFDGQGIAHPRGMGLASHAALFLDLPSVGCAKTRLVGKHREVGRDQGALSSLEFAGKQIGAVVRTRADVKPVFVSPGHGMSIETAARLVLSTCRGYRLPEPVRLAHQLANRVRREARPEHIGHIR